MTILIASFISSKNGSRYPVAMSDWAVLPNPSGESCTVAQVILMAEAPPIKCTFDEFLAMLADGGKVLDLRKLQE